MLPLAADNLLILDIIIRFYTDANTNRSDFNDQVQSNTGSSVSLMVEFWKNLGSKPVISNCASIAGWILELFFIQWSDENLIKYCYLAEI